MSSRFYFDDILIWSGVYFFSLFVLLVGEWKDHFKLRAFAKTFTSLLFVTFGVFVFVKSPEKPTWSVWMMFALLFGAIGDVFLVPKESKLLFKVGSYCFLLGHVFYLVAFSTIVWNWLWVGIACAGLFVGGAFVMRWLWGSVPANFKFLVLAYIVVESLMVVAATGAAGSGEVSALVIPASILFYFSDVSVARDRFVKTPNFWNRLWGLPFYYIAQWLFVIAMLQSLDLI